MRKKLRLALMATLATVVAGVSARAEQRTMPPKPYQAVAVTLPQPIEEASFQAFRSELAGVAKARVYIELERIVMPQGFFWDRDFGGAFNAKRSGAENLAAAIGLERRNGAGWAALARFASETTAAPFIGRPGIFCAPGQTRYDEVDFDRLLDSTRSDGLEWAAPRADKTQVHKAPRSNAGVIETLGLVLVRVLGYRTQDRDAGAIRAAWVRIVSPSGKIGFVAPGSLSPLTAERLCYGKDGFGRWRIAGFVGGGD